MILDSSNKLEPFKPRVSRYLIPKNRHNPNFLSTFNPTRSPSFAHLQMHGRRRARRLSLATATSRRPGRLPPAREACNGPTALPLSPVSKTGGVDMPPWSQHKPISKLRWIKVQGTVVCMRFFVRRPATKNDKKPAKPCPLEAFDHASPGFNFIFIYICCEKKNNSHPRNSK